MTEKIVSMQYSSIWSGHSATGFYKTAEANIS